METTRKKKASLAIASVALVAIMAIAGTFAYLQSSTEDVTNTFNTNSVTVDLKETGNRQYNIVPGTSEDKDPTVTVKATVPAYVFVEVTDTANVDGKTVIEYSLESGWIQLKGYNNVYYREVKASDEAQTFAVLAGNKVSYPSTLTNDDMPENDVTLVFKASAIQKEPFNDPVLAYKMDAPAKVSTADDFAKALEGGGAVELTEDVIVPASAIPGNAPVSIDLNGKSLTVSKGVEGANGKELGIAVTSDLDIKGGTINWSADTPTVFALGSNGDLTLDGVTLNSTATINVEAGTDPATLNIVNSTIKSTDYYCVSTNAANNATGENVTINIKDSNLSILNGGLDKNGDNTGILFNIPGTLNVENTTVQADRQAVIVRCGTANIVNSNLICTGEAPQGWHGKYDENNWESGNEVPVAVLVAGNRSSANAYPYNAAVALSGNTKLTYDGQDGRPLVYAAAYNGHTTTVSGISESSCMISEEEGSTVTIVG